MKHAPHSLLALLTVLSLSESAHGTGREKAPSAEAAATDLEIAEKEQMDEALRASREYTQRIQEAEDERLARAISEDEAEAWLRRQAQMAQGSSAAAASPEEPRSRKSPRSGYGAAADSPTDSEMAAQAQIDEVIAASLESERRRQEHEGQMARASAASVAEDRPWFLPAGVSPGDSQAVRARKKLQAERVAEESDGPDDDSEFKPD